MHCLLYCPVLPIDVTTLISHQGPYLVALLFPYMWQCWSSIRTSTWLPCSPHRCGNIDLPSGPLHGCPALPIDVAILISHQDPYIVAVLFPYISQYWSPIRTPIWLPCSSNRCGNNDLPSGPLCGCLALPRDVIILISHQGPYLISLLSPYRSQYWSPIRAPTWLPCSPHRCGNIDLPSGPLLGCLALPGDVKILISHQDPYLVALLSL